jgi:hypothetical protein
MTNNDLESLSFWAKNSNNDILENKIHLKFCKILLNLKTSTPSYMLFGELEPV